MKRVIAGAALGIGAYLTYQAMKPRYSYRGKHVLITGGSRGLGLVLARELAKQGARLSICSRDAQELRQGQEDLARHGVEALAVECDLTERNRVQEFIAVAQQRNGPVDVLINNAGVIQVGPLETMTEADFQESLLTHFWAALFTILEVLPQMKSRRTGRIINIASIGGKIAVPHLLAYSAGKFALVGLSQGLRAELTKEGVTVTTVCPGLMRTGSHINAQFKGRHREEYTWFAAGNAIPGLSMKAERAARRILDGAARGDAEIVLGLPYKLAVAAHNLFPNLSARMMALVDQYLLPRSDRADSTRIKGVASRGLLPDFVTTLSDRAARDNNEVGPAHAPPPLRAGS